MFARTPMATNVSGFVLSLVTEYGGSALSLVRKGISAIRRLLGHVGAFVRPLLREGLTALSAKLAAGGAVVREKASKAGSALLRLAKKFMGQRPEDEHETTMETEPSREISVPVQADSGASAARPVASKPENASILPRDAARTLGPIVGRALVRALSQPRRPRVTSTAPNPGA